MLALIVLQAVPAAQGVGGSISSAIKDAQADPRRDHQRRTRTPTWCRPPSPTTGVFVSFVSIGRYTLTAELVGFSVAKQQPFEIRIGDRVRIDLTLQVGALSETVTVTGESMLLETSTASRGQVISREQVSDLPLLGRNPFMLALSARACSTPTLASRSNRPSTTAAWTP
jgi:hypothetical protein